MTLQGRMNAYWSRWAEEYDTQQTTRLRSVDALRTWRSVWQRALAPVGGDDAPAGGSAAPAGRGASRAGGGDGRVLDVLDVGTGSGNVALMIAGLGHTVTGIDLASGMLETARAKASGVCFLPGDAIDPPFAPGSFDAVVSRYVLWTLRDARAAFDAWHRLLRPGGIVAAVDSAWFPEDSELGEGLDGQRRADFRGVYGAGALDELTLGRGRETEVTAALRDSGFVQVTAIPLRSVLELDRRQGVAPGHRPQMQMLYRAVRDAGESPPSPLRHHVHAERKR